MATKKKSVVRFHEASVSFECQQVDGQKTLIVRCCGIVTRKVLACAMQTLSVLLDFRRPRVDGVVWRLDSAVALVEGATAWLDDVTSDVREWYYSLPVAVVLPRHLLPIYQQMAIRRAVDFGALHRPFIEAGSAFSWMHDQVRVLQRQAVWDQTDCPT